MCDICDENNGEMASCQDCGRLICFDVKQGDDIVARAYITASGDLFCSRCGRQYDEAEEHSAEEDDCYYGDDPFPEAIAESELSNDEMDDGFDII